MSPCQVVVLSVVVLCMVVSLCPPSVHSWPFGLVRYECNCPQNIYPCRTFRCGNKEFMCVCSKCSCFPEESQKPKAEDDDFSSEEDINLWNMIIKQGLLNRKR